MAPLALVLWASAPAWADGAAQPGTRPLGTGGALRAAATGDAGPMLNPSGISLMRAYVAEGAYQYGSRDSAHDLHVSIVDSTSGFNLGGALSYTFHTASPPGASQTGHLGGASLSFPIGDIVFLGASAKYLYLSTDTNDATNTTKGFIFDAGLTVRPLPLFSVGVVGYNLANRANSLDPQAVGGGVCVNVIPGLSLVLDSVFERVYGDPTRSQAYYIMGGGEYLVRTVALRLGGGRDGLSENGYLSGGVSLASSAGALDLALREDIAGDRKGTYVGVSARLFVPSQ